MSGLNQQEMFDVALAFQEANTFVLANSEPAVFEKIQTFMAECVVMEKPYLMVTAEGIKAIGDKVFKDKDLTDYVFSAWFCFASRWASSDESISALANNFARGCAQVDGITHTYCKIPPDYKQRLSTRSVAAATLFENPWLMVLLLIKLTVKIPTDAKK